MAIRANEINVNVCRACGIVKATCHQVSSAFDKADSETDSRAVAEH